ncbi:MAG: Spy/CpxP family protein refolding chaperone [Pseudorhodoplanes sp.]
MWVALRAGVFVLATMGFVFLQGTAPASAQQVVLTDGKIAQLKAVLNLSPAQEPHWRMLMAAMREVLSRQRPDENAGFVQRVKARVGSYVLTATSAQQIAAAARPLIASLSEEQKRDGMMVVNAMGVASLF